MARAWSQDSGAGPMAGEASLAHTPTWVVATVCLAIFSVSIAAERFLHYLGESLKHRQQKALFSVLRRLKQDLLLLGFISFLLSVFQGYIVHICIPETSTRFMLPCKKGNHEASTENEKLCKQKGDVPLLSSEALYQLRIFILLLGLVHIVFCTITILFGGAKMRRWKIWEKEIHQEIKEKMLLAELGRKDTSSLGFVLHQNNQSKFVNERTKGFWMKLAVMAFLKPFYDSVSKSDYAALRSTFVFIHYPNRLDFDFHKYMIRALQDNLKRVLGFSWYLWLFVILFLLLNINGWHTYFWLAFLPLFLLLIVGAKLDHIITELAQEAEASLSSETEGDKKIKPSKEYFWFHKPGLLLHLIHFILFQNYFEIGFSFWVLISDGFGSCMMGRKVFAVSVLIIGLMIEVICSYITLPLYTIVTNVHTVKLPFVGLVVHESDRWDTGTRRKQTRKKIGGFISDEGKTGSNLDPGTEVEVTRVPNEQFGSSSNVLTATTSHDLNEIITVEGEHNFM